MNPYAAGMLRSILGYPVVGNYAGRRVKHPEDYFAAGVPAPTLLVFGGLVATLMVVFYAIPYRRAVGHAATGEMAPSPGVGLLVAVTGALAWLGAVRSGVADGRA